MSDERRNPVWPWIVALLIGLPVLYVASFGPVCALAEHDVLPLSVMTTGFFKPCFAVAANSAKPIRKITLAWMKFCGGDYALADAIARKEFEESPYPGVSGGLFP
jgi:hypothetical protein